MADICNEGLAVAVVIAMDQIVVAALPVSTGRRTSQSDHRGMGRTEQKRIVLIVVEEWLDAKRVPAAREPIGLSVVHGEREHPIGARQASPQTI